MPTTVDKESPYTTKIRTNCQSAQGSDFYYLKLVDEQVSYSNNTKIKLFIKTLKMDLINDIYGTSGNTEPTDFGIKIKS